MDRTTPRWGWVTAQPHEHLLLLRDGLVARRQQGGSLWKWPGDTVAVVDTSIRRLQFTADQVTREKVGVQVTGLAVYRVVQPLLAYRMLDLARPDATGLLLQEMFTGATRRLVANLSLEDCMTRRKDALAAELMAEIAPVVGGSGRLGDQTERGWGIALDTIEVQDVRVQSAEVFESLQATYRGQLALGALEAEVQVSREQARLAAQAARDAEDRRRAQMAQEEERLTAERARERTAAVHRSELQSLEATAEEAQEARRHAAARKAAEDHAATRLAVARQEAEAERILGQARSAVTRLEREATDGVSEQRLQELLLTQTLPEVARAFRDSYDQVTVTGGGAEFLGSGLAQVLATARSFGLSLPGDRGAGR